MSGEKTAPVRIAFLLNFLYPRASQAAWPQGMPWRLFDLFQRGRAPVRRKMPKLKTKSGVKKRFKLTATGKVKAGVAGKRHRLISHNAKYIRQNRGTKVMADADAKAIKRFMNG